jgi:RimJ/RimL family protein N-acetyltransferase
MPTLETDRLILRELERSDVDPLLEVLGDPWTMRFYPHPFSRDEVVAWVERWRASYATNGFGLMALELKESGRLVGDTGLSLQHVDGEAFPEVGWHVHRSHQRQGLATEGARACLDDGFRSIGLERIISLIRPENVPSWRVAEKLGMRIWKETNHSGLRHRVYVADPAGSPQ